jgi:hypothetical protein
MIPDKYFYEGADLTSAARFSTGLVGNMEDIGSSIESDFLDLVEYAPTREAFHRGAAAMLGLHYRETGAQIVSELGPELQKKFDSYFAEEGSL